METVSEVPASNAPENAFRRAVLRGLAHRCPACGRGHIFRAYLKPVAECPDCGENFSHIRADDGPAWLTILIVGHVVVALALAIESTIVWPLWASLLVFTALTLAMTLALLPSAKGAFIAAIWSTGAREAAAPVAADPAADLTA